MPRPLSLPAPEWAELIRSISNAIALLPCVEVDRVMRICATELAQRHRCHPGIVLAEAAGGVARQITNEEWLDALCVMHEHNPDPPRCK